MSKLVVLKQAGQFLLAHHEKIIGGLAAIASLVAALKKSQSQPGLIRIEIYPAE